MSEDYSEEVPWSSSVRQPEYVLRSEFKTASDGTNYGLFNLDPNSEQATDLGRGELWFQLIQKETMTSTPGMIFCILHAWLNAS